MLYTTRKCITNIARICVFIDRHLASWERFLADAQWDLRGISHRLVTERTSDRRARHKVMLEGMITFVERSTGTI